MSVNIDALVNSMAQDGNLWLGQLQLPHAKRFLRNAVRKFYGMYSPLYYRRRYSLHKMARFVVSGEPFLIELGGEFSGMGHRVSEEYIYENSFKRGYHGGAISGPGHPSPGVPLWRVPYPEYTFWGGVARCTAPPYNLFVQWWNNFVVRQGPHIKTVVLKRLKQKYMAQILEYLYE